MRALQPCSGELGADQAVRLEFCGGASGASKRRKDLLQKSDVATGCSRPIIDHSALYSVTSGGNLCMMLSIKDKVQARASCTQMRPREYRRSYLKHHLTSHIYFGDLSAQVLQY